METQRQESFKRLRPACVELSSVGLAFRGNHTLASNVVGALEPLQKIIEELANQNKLDEKLAEYAFFPLTHIFNETKRLPARCLELAVKCLQLLVADGWRQQLSPAMGKQLIILLTLIPLKAQAVEELSIACFECLHVIFDMLEGPTAEQTIFHEIGTATVVDQTIYILLEGIVDERSDDLCVSASRALKALFSRISDRVVLASIMPRTVSALAKVVKPTTQTRRSYKLLQASLEILNYLLKTVLNDRVSMITEKPKPVDVNLKSETLALDQSWLKATTTQIKLALVNIIQVRRHQRQEVQTAMLDLCVMVIENCPVTLKDAVPLMTDTMVVLADKEGEEQNEAYQILAHLTTTYPIVLDSLKESLHSWLLSFPRIMQSNDETAKQWGIRQISTAFQVISEIQSGSEILTSSLATGLCNSVREVVKLSTSGAQPLASISPESLRLDIIGPDSQSMEFPPILLEHQSQQQTLKDLRSMIKRLNLSESGNEITRLVVNRMRTKSDETDISPFWLALESLRSQSQSMAVFDDFLVDDQTDQHLSVSSRAAMIDELYYNSLIILTELPADGSGDWRTLALALEAVALQAQQLGQAFRPELMEALYPTLQLLASNNPVLQRHAMTCLNILTKSCNYPDTSTMIIENVDYLVNSVALKLNSFDVSPYPPQVLFMMVKLSGPRLIPYLDDVVDSIFGIIDMYHGYPKLVELLFKCLAAIVEAGSKKQSLLTIDDGRESGPHDHRKSQPQHLLISALATDLANRKSKRVKYEEEEGVDVDGKIPHPKKPWSETYEKPPAEPESIEELLNKADSDEPLPPPKEPEDAEKPLSKTHSLLLHIVKSIPSHLSSPSPYLRRSLLAILIDVLPTLSQNENSFLPLINDLWPSVASRIIFPSSLSSESSSTSLIPQSSKSTRSTPQPDTQSFQEETYVITAACQAIEAMCKGAGDFMASRIEPEFLRWERLYQRVWSKVRQEAEASNERRARQQREAKKSSQSSSLIQSMDSDASSSATELTITSALAISPLASGSGSRAFTPHHALWRALLSLFLTILTRVCLPLETGDRICENLAAWIALFVGPKYYFRSAGKLGSDSYPIPGLDDAQKNMLDSVDDAINAMETWNADLTWFLFVQQRDLMEAPSIKPVVSEIHGAMSVNIDGQVFNFAEVVF
ncbi:Armadillo-like helical [Penicillium malachiteum]|uniref:Armadillo-like helical n=1 Tax=Penicillium malachiteum TaxID=1324776 RepID=UPI002546A96F|nr:Armadillo-like helical [Penicillium malachiteum]KAJ5737153.1 Armadillo-like helical [Penicillium malachiteum]